MPLLLRALATQAVTIDAVGRGFGVLVVLAALTLLLYVLVVALRSGRDHDR